MRALFAAVLMLLLPAVAAGDPIAPSGKAIRPTAVASRGEQAIQSYIASLPFTISALGNFRITGLVGNQGLTLTNGPLDADPDDRQTNVFVITSPTVPARGERQALSRWVFLTRRNMQIVRVDSEKNLTAGGYPAHEIIAHVRNDSGTELQMAEWVIFGNGTTLVVLVSSRPDLFVSVLPEIVAVRDAIHLK